MCLVIWYSNSLNQLLLKSTNYLCPISSTQQTMTCDSTCSVSEFTSSTGSIHVFLPVNSLDSVNKFGVSTRVYREITTFQRDDTYQ